MLTFVGVLVLLVGLVAGIEWLMERPDANADIEDELAKRKRDAA